ncbi:unnamed protein product [Protopolystoma xenopodis]|uniref:Hexosyltransferase n=1 Tax=Protopolystoma xenopodis TaxID=117903 RepID=A0A448WAR5_9PLAT|nr:unnamed protein product [Protopolystoma xenopodis]
MIIKIVVASILINAASVFAKIDTKQDMKITLQKYEKEALGDWEALVRLDATKSSASLRSLGRKCHPQKHHQASKWRQDQYRPLRNAFPAFTNSNFRSFPGDIDVLQAGCIFREGLALPPGHTLTPEIEEITLLINCPQVCAPWLGQNGVQSEDIDLLIMIKSKGSEVWPRDVLRRGWLNNSCWAGRNVRHVFLLGRESPNRYRDMREQKLKQESNKYGDIVMLNFLESYHNNTYKLILGYAWPLAFCKSARWVLYADSDMFIHSGNLLGLLSEISPEAGARMVVGNIQSSMHAMRAKKDRKSKWDMPNSEYPYNLYEQYPSGGSYIIGFQVLLDIYLATRFTKLIRIDDAFIGLALKKLQIAPWHTEGLVRRAAFEINETDIISFHQGRSLNVQLALWKSLQLDKLCVTAR